MKLEKQFIGAGLDMDSSNEFIAPNDLISAFNCRSIGTDENELGCITSIEGNELIPHLLPSGINKCIGAKSFDDVSKAYFWLYNSNNFHRIEEYDYETNAITTIFENKTDSAGQDIMKLRPSKPVKDIELIDGRYLKWNDANSSPKEIDVLRIKDNEYGLITAHDIEQIKAQPLVKMGVEYISDPGKNTNLLAKKLFQFRYKYIYWNNEESAWSVYSDRKVPIEEPTPSQVSDVTKSNGLRLDLNVGTNRVRDIVISGRYDNMDWFTVKSVAREDIISIQNTNIAVSQEIYESYFQGTYSFLFYNDGLYEYDDVLTGDLPYDYLPRVANAMELANGNVMLFGGIKEGYPRPKQDIDLGVTYYDPQITITPTDQSTALKATYNQSRISNSHQRSVNIILTGSPRTGDSIVISMVVITSGQVLQLAQYDVPSSQNNNLNSVANSIASLLPGSWVADRDGGKMINFPSEPYQELSSVVIDYVNKTSGQSKSVPILKTNSAYQAALRYKDEFGRFFPIQTNKDFILNTKSLAQTSGLVPKIDWQINSQYAPSGATTYQWMISTNNTHQTQLTINGKFLDIEDENYLRISLSSLIQFNKDNPSSILNYEYSEGDRCTFQYYLNDADVPEYFKAELIDVEVVSFGPVVVTPDDPATPDINEEVIDYILKVRRPPSINMNGFYLLGVNIIGKELLLEIYSPKRGTIGSDTKVYYETGPVYKVNSDGTHSVTSGSIKEADSYYKTREILKASEDNELHVFYVEDFNFSDYYKSDFYSLGRAGSLYDTPEDIYLKASVRYSDSFNKYTNNNGLTRFFPERLVDYDEIYGAIQYLEQRDNIVVCIQELKVGYIPINQSIIEDQIGQQNVAVSDVLLNKIRYSKGINIGIGRAINSYAVYGGFIYFVDPNRSEPVRIGLDGVDTISKKASKYFKKTIREIYASGRDIIGYYDVYNNEYVISYANIEDEVISLPFVGSNWKTQDSYTVTPAEIMVPSTQTLGTATYDNSTGVAIFTPSPNTTGLGRIVFSFTKEGDPINRGECIQIGPASAIPNPFSFFPKVNVLPSTQVESNIIGVGGINVPAAISVSIGEYSVNGGAWTSTSGYVINGDTVKYRITSSAAADGLVTGILTIGTVSGSFSVTTKGVNTTVYAHIGRYGGRQLRVELRTSDVYGQGVLATLDCPITIPLSWRASGIEVDDIIRDEFLTFNAGQNSKYTTVGSGGETISCVDLHPNINVPDCAGFPLEIIIVYQPSLIFCAP